MVNYLNFIAYNKIFQAAKTWLLTVCNYEYFPYKWEKNNGETILQLIKSNLVKSAHDVSIGGIITAVSKMCIKGNKGIEFNKPKFLMSEIEYFFSEDQGRYIIEINPKDLKKVTNILEKNSVHYDEIGKIVEKDLVINKKTKVTIDELKSYNTNWFKSYMG